MMFKRLLCLLTILLCGCTEAFAGTFQDFDLPVMNRAAGDTYSSANDKVLVVEAYFNGCSSCQTNAANVKKIADEFHKDEGPIQVLDFGYDCDQADYDSWIRRHRPTEFVVKGCEAPFLDEMQITAYPTTLIFDRNHNLLKKYVGVWSQSRLREIQALLRSMQ